ncbi:hypothetical protein QLX08_003815 [Tetragonisca angustula]|uniref:Lysosome-associated membrane glycoprotein 5 n=1 Tax=Tetragonisca angustula TaxID=166442 RepID=A0AAW1A8J8_9HYME
MMSKFLLLLCFTAVHVLGEGQENILSKDKIGISLQNEQHLEANISLNKTVPLEPVTATLEPVTDKNNLKSAEVLIKQSSIQSSTIIPNHSAVTLSSANVLIRTNETSEKILHTTMKSAVMYSPVKSTSTSHSAGKWVVVDKTNEICIVVQMSVMFNISYINDNNTKFMVFDVPTDNVTTKASGSCGELEQTLTLEWASKNITNGSMTLHFIKNIDEYSLHHLEVILPSTDFSTPTIKTSVILIHEASDFVVKLSNSYRCLKQQMLNLKQNNTNETFGYLTVSGFQFQAFKVDNSTVFGLAKDCAFDTPDVVPIAVGCALAGLVIIVLIAYLIGRHRNQANGYLSM